MNISCIRAEAPRTRKASQEALSRHMKAWSAGSWLTPRIHLCDQHHLSFHPWMEALADGVIGKKALLVNADNHNDLAVANDVVLPEGLFNYPQGVGRDRLLADSGDFVTSLTHSEGEPEASFIIPALAIGLYSRVIHVVEGKGGPKWGTIHFEMADYSGKKYLESSRIAEGSAAADGVRWGTTTADAFAKAIHGVSGHSVLSLDLDYFDAIEGDPVAMMRGFFRDVAVPMGPDLLTIALSRSYTFRPLDEQFTMLRTLLDLCYDSGKLAG